MKVAVIGGVNNPEKYAYRAVKELLAAGHQVFPVNPAGGNVLGCEILKSTDELPEGIDVVSIYINSSNSNKIIDSLLSIRPKNVILNPGAENRELSDILSENGINVKEACTLIMLKTGNFKFR